MTKFDNARAFMLHRVLYVARVPNLFACITQAYEVFRSSPSVAHVDTRVEPYSIQNR